MKNPALTALTVIAVVGLIVGLAGFALIQAGMFDRYDFATGTLSGPSPLVALIPAGIGVLAGIAAQLLWGMQQGRTSSSN